MLLGKDFGRYKHTRLVAVVFCQQHREQCDQCLSAAYIALYQSVHLAVAVYIATNLLDNSFLCSGKFKRQVLVVETVEHSRKIENISCDNAGLIVCNGGLNSLGNDQLDEGLRGRGLVGSLPVPSYPGNASGKIVIRVAVDQHGKVTSATYEPKGSTSSDGALIAAAIAAAKRAQLTESRSYVQGGTITYNFKLN